MQAASFYAENFFITDPADWGYLSVAIDYDDGFIAYLNGTEIGRSPSMNNVAGNYNDVATTYVEALLYNGGQPLQSTWTAQDIEELLVPGENVFAVQVHNNSANSSDLTIRPFLGLTRKDGTDTFWPAPPEWWPEFEYHMHTSFADLTERNSLSHKPFRRNIGPTPDAGRIAYRGIRLDEQRAPLQDCAFLKMKPPMQPTMMDRAFQEFSQPQHSQRHLDGTMHL